MTSHDDSGLKSFDKLFIGGESIISTGSHDSAYGLSGCIYSSDLELAESLARRMRTGQVFLNSASACVVEPFGGYKCGPAAHTGMLATL